MKRPPVTLLSIFVLLFALIGCGSSATSLTPKTALSTSALVSHEGYSTVALVQYDEDHEDDKTSNIRPYCSAVWVDETHILTAHHCVKSIQEEAQEKQNEKEKNPVECNPIAKLFGACKDAPAEHKTIYLNGLPIHYVQWKEVDDVGKEPTAWHLAKVVGWDEHKDLALLEAQGHAVPSHEYAKLADKTPELTEAVHVCGHPKGLYWTFLEGTVAGYRGEIPGMEKKAGPFMQVQTPIFFGNSGGGAFNNNGELIGIADFLMRLPAEGFFVHLDNIRAFLQDQHLLAKPEVKEEKKVVIGVAPHENASPDPRPVDPTKGDPLKGLLTPPDPDKKDEKKEEPKPMPQPQFHIPSYKMPPLLPPGLKPLFPPGLKPQ